MPISTVVRAQLLFTGLSGLAGVAFGAYGSHGLTGKVPADRQTVFLTATNYQIMHTAVMAGIVALRVSLISSGVKTVKSPAIRCLDLSFVLIAAGVLGFSGTIYSKVLGGPAWLAPITPKGGMSLMAGWLALAATGLLL